MITDDITITVQAGKGGDGSISFRREKYVPKGGPDGGNGGKGGDVYLVGVKRIHALNAYRAKKTLEAEKGGPGRGRKMHGKNGADLEVPIPVGTTITDTVSGKKYEINEGGERVLIAKGGEGGLGNWEFRSATNQTPRFAQRGRAGESVVIHCNLRFIADAGIIGLPNAGKSSLLNTLTNANVKIGDYAFTTLEANLASLDGYIIADIPGLIEGAHSGKGLGDKFLKHIAKTKLLIHCIDTGSETIRHDYDTIMHELDQYDPTLTQKQEILLLTKTDAVDAKTVVSKKKKLASLKRPMYAISILDEKSIEAFKTALVSALDSIARANTAS